MTNPDSGTVITKLLQLASEDPSYLAKLDTLRRAIVVMFTDIQGSTAYFEQHGDAAGLLMVHRCNDTLQQIVHEHAGRVIKTIGDGMLATFEDPRKSIRAAIAMQKNLQTLNPKNPRSNSISIRIGLHFGTGIVRTNDVFGDVVNVASRIESAALPRQILISEPIYAEVREEEFTIVEKGQFLLKGKSSAQTLYEVVWDPSDGRCLKADRGPIPSSLSFRLQVLDRDYSPTAEYPIVTSVTIGRYEGDLRFSDDADMASLNARIFLDDGYPVLEDLSQGKESVFLKVSGAYTLQNEDIILMGQQVLKFSEVEGALEAGTQLGASLVDITKVLKKPVAEVLQLNPKGRAAQTLPIRSSQVQFGRVRGDFTFEDDRLMSRLHARILQRAEDFLLEDLGSRNGTFVKVRTKARVPIDGEILVGNALLRVVH
jgi:class 3 adenylate cyclase